MYIKPLENRPPPKNEARVQRKGKESDNTFAETLESVIGVDSVEITRSKDDDEESPTPRRKPNKKKREPGKEGDQNLDITA